MRVAIVGAGIVGRLLAWQLAQQDYQVTLFDQGDASGSQSCSSVAAGMLAPLAELERSDTLIYTLGTQSLQLWQQWLPQLQQSVLFKQLGSVVIAHPQDAGELARYIAIIKRKLTDNQAVQLITVEQLAQLEPDIMHNMQAVFLAGEGQIATQELLQALYTQLQLPSVRWQLNTKVTNLQAYRVDQQPFDWVFDCRGLGAKPDLPSLRGVRGELLLLHCPEITISRPVRVLHPRYKIYLVPRANHHYIVGATEIDSEDFGPISVRSTLELLNAVYMINSGFAEARIIATRTQCRPAFNDNQPKIFSKPGLTAINGLFRHGYLLAPALIANVIHVIVKHQSSEIPIWQMHP